jgi:SAM-dependent methyltransferase
MRCLFALLALTFAALPQADEYNSTYRGESSGVFLREPNGFLVEMTRARKAGTALDVGMGQGRNAIYLARQGWDVTGIDAADEGVKLARLEAARLGVKLNAVVTRFEDFDFGANRWDLIVMAYVPIRAIAAKIERALKPGGALLIEDRHDDSLRIWPAGQTFGNNELLSIAPALRILRYEDVVARPDWSVKKLDQRIVRLFAEKPLPREPGCLWEGQTIAAGQKTCWGAVTFRCRGDGWQVVREKCSP